LIFNVIAGRQIRWCKTHGEGKSQCIRHQQVRATESLGLSGVPIGGINAVLRREDLRNLPFTTLIPVIEPLQLLSDLIGPALSRRRCPAKICSWL
jgi:hypothetical protein